MDGGIYRGNWRGGKKEGLGVYTYPSGARYEGRWEDNVKHGLGIYHFPKVLLTEDSSLMKAQTILSRSAR